MNDYMIVLLILLLPLLQHKDLLDIINFFLFSFVLLKITLILKISNLHVLYLKRSSFLVEVALEKLRKLVWDVGVTWCQRSTCKSEWLLVSTWFPTSRRQFRRPLLTDLSLIRWSSNFCSLIIRTISISRPFQWVGKLALAKSKFFCIVSNFPWSFLYSASAKRCEYKLKRNSS